MAKRRSRFLFVIPATIGFFILSAQVADLGGEPLRNWFDLPELKQCLSCINKGLWNQAWQHLGQSFKISFYALTFMCVLTILGLIHFFIESRKQAPVTEQYIDKKFFEYFGEKPKNPPVEEVKGEIEKELKAAFEKQEKKALHLYEKGSDAYYKNKFKEAIIHFEDALKIVKIPSFYLSLGNSYLSNSDFMKALTNCQTALKLYRIKKDRQGKGSALGSLGVVYSSRFVPLCKLPHSSVPPTQKQANFVTNIT